MIAYDRTGAEWVVSCDICGEDIASASSRSLAEKIGADWSVDDRRHACERCWMLIWLIIERNWDRLAAAVRQEGKQRNGEQK